MGNRVVKKISIISAFLLIIIFSIAFFIKTIRANKLINFQESTNNNTDVQSLDATTTEIIKIREGELRLVDEDKRIYKIENSEQMVQLLPSNGKSLGSGFSVAYLGGEVVSDNDSTAVIVEDSKLVDSDNDGLNGVEEIKYGTDPENSDTDGDGYGDGEEIKNGFSPTGLGKLN